MRNVEKWEEKEEGKGGGEEGEEGGELPTFWIRPAT